MYVKCSKATTNQLHTTHQYVLREVGWTSAHQTRFNLPRSGQKSREHRAYQSWQSIKEITAGDIFSIISPSHSDLGVQQCLGVVYHELTTLRRVYFARAALAAPSLFNDDKTKLLHFIK